MEKTISFLRSFLKQNDKVVLGLSGGPDSMCLLNLLLELPMKLNIICVHVNHNIREESAEEALFVLDYCRKKNIKFETITIPKKSLKKDYNEQELREKRYEFFLKMVSKYKAKYLFTAHHGDDLVETVLMRLTRGSNIKGYSGIQMITEKSNYKIIRPLLFVTKEDIQKYIETNKIPVVIDKTNLSDKYTRNRYRHHVLPFLKKENEFVHLKYLKYSQELYQYYDFVNKIVLKELSNRFDGRVLNLKEIDKLDNLIMKKLIEKVLDRLYVDNLYLINSIHVKQILDLIKNGKPNVSLNLPDGLNVIKAYDQLIMSRNIDVIKDYKIKLEDKTLLPNGHYIEKKKSSDNVSNYCIRLNSDELKLPLYVRNRCIGDRMIIKNMMYSKKIKDIYIDCKLPIGLRAMQPVVVDSNDTIIWLPGLKKSKFDKEKKQKYDIILWYN